MFDRFEAASYLESSSRILQEKGDQNACKLFAEEAGNIYERGISSLLKHTLLLYFAYADFEEVSLLYADVDGKKKLIKSKVQEILLL